MNKNQIKLVAFFTCLFLVVFPLLTLTSCNSSPVEKEGVLESLLPNLWVFLAHVVATITLMSICIWLVWKPTKESLAKRREYIANEIKDAENAKLRTLKQLQEAEQTKIKAFDEAKQIINNATIQAYQQKEQIQLEAKNIADKTRAAAESEAIKIKENMKNEMRKQIIDIAFDVSSSLLKEKVTQDDTEKFVDDFIQTLSEQKSSNK